MILGIFTELGQDGGVQRMGRHMALAISKYGQRIGKKTEIWSLNDIDDESIVANSIDMTTTGFRGFGRNRYRLFYEFLLKSRSLDGVYVNHMNLVLLPFVASCFSPKLRYVVHLHGIEAWKRCSYLRQMAVGRAIHITASSMYTLKLFRDNNPSCAECCGSVLYPCVDSGLLENRNLESDGISYLDRLGLLSGRKGFFLTVARLGEEEKEKHVESVIQAFATTPLPGWSLVIVGEGNDRQRLMGVAKALGIGESVLFLGHVGDRELRYLYAGCDVFVLPSAKEGFGIVFLEAMASGKAVIGGNAGGTPEIVVNRETGYLVTPGDTPELARHMQEIASDRDRRIAMGRAGYERLSTRFSQKSFEQALESALNHLWNS